jgi:hypothetical protein
MMRENIQMVAMVSESNGSYAGNSQSGASVRLLEAISLCLMGMSLRPPRNTLR